MDVELVKPLPVPTPVSRPFWEGLADGKVRIQKCDACGTWVFYPRSRCSSCLSDRLRWRDVSGKGTLYTFTIARQPTSPHFADETPQLLAVVELDEGVRLMSLLHGCTIDEVEIGMPVRLCWDTINGDFEYFAFEPDK